MANVHVARRVALTIALAIPALMVARRSEPGPPPQGARPFPTANLVTPLLSTDLTHAGTWLCSAVNASDAPLSVTVRAFHANGQEVSFDDHVCMLDPGRTCSRFWETGIAGHYCTFTFHGKDTAIRAGLQVSDEDGFSLFAEAH